MKTYTLKKIRKIALFRCGLLTFKGEKRFFSHTFKRFKKDTPKKFLKHARELKKHQHVFLLIYMYFFTGRCAFMRKLRKRDEILLGFCSGCSKYLSKMNSQIDGKIKK